MESLRAVYKQEVYKQFIASELLDVVKEIKSGALSTLKLHQTHFAITDEKRTIVSLSAHICSQRLQEHRDIMHTSAR